MFKLLNFFLIAIILRLSLICNILNAQPVSPISLYDIENYIIDSPIFYGQEYLDTEILFIGNLIEATKEIYNENKYDIKIYNNDTLYYLPDGTGALIAIVSDKDMIGFNVLEYQNDDDIKEEGKIIFSFICKLELDYLHGGICYEPKVLINGKNLPIGQAIKSHEIFKRAFRNSDFKIWRNFS
ncbi:MAG: hypothetical protein LBD41_01915 [Clostridiales Family XIII bacterium]|jgi:hypothetical protein|nr:hypothetical protein [Clostridiales Family XIII bacterium]